MQNIPLENLFLIDIETVSGVQHFNLLDDEWKALWTEKIIKNLPPDTTSEQYYPMRAAILAEFARVVCISIGYFKKENNDGPDAEWQLRIKSFYSENEKEVLQGFIKTLHQCYSKNSKWIYAGHNIKEFDIPFLCRRMIINNIEIQLIPKTIRGNFSASAGGNVVIQNGSSVSLPAGGIINVATNSAYTGIVNVIGAYLDPTDPKLSLIMPGNLCSQPNWSKDRGMAWCHLFGIRSI